MDASLVHLVKENRVRYDPRHENYTSWQVKAQVWDNIAKKLQLRDGERAKHKWSRLRGGYRDARRRQRRLRKSGVAPENLKQWKLQKEMAFLEDFLLPAADETENEESDEELSPAFKVRRDWVPNILKRSKRQEKWRRLKLNSTIGAAVDDPLFNFFTSMYQLTKSLPLNYQLRIRNELYGVICQAEKEVHAISDIPMSSSPSP